MLEPPDIPIERIVAHLWDAYDLRATAVDFLPIGADENSAAYQVVAPDGARYFVKLRRGAFREVAVTLPRYLYDAGIAEIIPPVTTREGALYAALDPFTTILYPYIEGRNGFEVALNEAQWAAFGAAMRRVHTLALPPALEAAIPRETYAPRYRESLRRSLDSIPTGVWADPVAAGLAAFLRAHREETLDLVERAERYAVMLQAESPPFVVCHTDVHAGNLLIATDGRLYIVDWDEPLRAPKERDLMFIGGGQAFLGGTPADEEWLFYRGYGPTDVSPVALIYYRYERIVVDLAIFCEQLLLSDAGGADRARALSFVTSNYVPGGPIAMARRAEEGLRAG